MSSSESTETLIRNPKESAVIFGCVVILAVVLEFAFSYFRNHRSSYISGLFGQLSEETMIVGCISLIFVFVVQSFPNLPDSWVVIFRWAQGVIFFMIVFFVVGVAWTAVISRILCVMIQKFEFRLLEALTRRQNSDICDMLRRHWQISDEDSGVSEGLSSANRQLLHNLEDAKEPESVQEDLNRLLRRRVGDLGQLRKEFGATAEIGGLPKIGDKEQRQRTKQVEEFLGDAALRLQDYFLEGSQFTSGGLRDPEPESTLQSALLVLRRVFLHQVRSKQYLPSPLHALIIVTERMRLTTYILDLESERRDLMAHWQAKRMTLQSHSAETARLRAAEALTYEDLMSQRRRTVNEMVASRGRAPSTSVGDEETLSTTIKRENDLIESLKESARVIASSYVAQRAETWISDGCIDPEVLCRYVPFSKYLYKRMRTTIISFVDITWQCWMSLVLLSSINSARLYLLPGQLQSKAELDTGDYRNEMFSFIFVIGYPPMIAFLVAFMMLMRNFRWYLRSVKVLKMSAFSAMEEGEGQSNAAAGLEQRVSMAPSTGDGGDEINETERKKRVGASVWLPPEQLAGQLAGDMYEDPSRYLLRGNKSFTLHTLKIPSLLTHFYFSMFVVKLWNTGGLGAELVGYVLLGIIPVIVVFGLLPIALFAYTSLMSLGLRVEDLLVYFTAARQCRRVGGKRVGSSQKNSDGENDSTDHDDEIATLVAPLVSMKRGSAASGEAENSTDRDLAAKSLARRVLGYVPQEMLTQSSIVEQGARNIPEDRQSRVDLGMDTSTIIAGTDAETELASTIRSGAPNSTMGAAMAEKNTASLRALEQKVLQLTLQKEALEGLVRSSTGMRVGNATLQNAATNDLSPSRRKGNSTAVSSSSMRMMNREGYDSHQQDSSTTRELLEYYKGLLMEQGSLVKELKEQVRQLEATHRGGVLHPAFYRAGESQLDESSSSLRLNRNVIGTTTPLSSAPQPAALPLLPEAVIAARAIAGQDARTNPQQPASSTVPPRRNASTTRRGLEPVHRAIERNQSIL